MPVTCDSPAAYVQYDLGAGSRLPTFVTDDKDWSIALWLRPSVPGLDGSIFQLSHSATPDRSAVHLRTVNGGRDVIAEVFDPLGTPLASASTTDIASTIRPLSPEAPSWTLVIVSFDNLTGLHSELSVRAVTSAGVTISSSAATFNPLSSSIAPFNRVRVGRSSLPGAAGVTATYGPVVVRAHATTPIDASRIWTNRSIAAPIAFQGGTWNGDFGAVWGTFHAFCSHPWDRDGGPGAPGLPGEFSTHSILTPSNTCIFDRGMTNATWLDAHSIRTAVGGTWSISLPDPFFAVTEPGYVGSPAVRAVPGTAPVLAALSHAVDLGRRRVLVSGNSRATRFIPDIRSDTGPWPQNWSGGLALARLNQVCGTFAVHPVATPGSVEFGADWLGGARASFRANTISTDRAMRRFSYGSQRNGDTLENGDMLGGPGGGVLIRPGGHYQTLTRQVPGSRYLWSNPREHAALFLAYPGSATAQISLRTSNLSLSDPDAPERIRGSRVVLDTTRLVATVVNANPLARTLTISGTGHAVARGDAVSTFNSATTWDATIIQSAKEVGADTVLTLEHWFDPAITVGPGRAVRIGSWDMKWLRIEAPADAPWSADLFQGHRVEADDAGPGPVCVLTEEWYALTDGYLFGSGGWSAHGYDHQVDNAFTTPRPQDNLSPFACFIRAIAPDAVLLTPAQQSGPEPSLGLITTALREALGPQSEIVWVADNAHGRSSALSYDDGWLDQDNSAWYVWMRANARAYGVPFLAAGIWSQGAFSEQYARGLRSDSVSHATSQGNLLWARAILADARKHIPLTLPGPTLPKSSSTLNAAPE